MQFHVELVQANPVEISEQPGSAIPRICTANALGPKGDFCHSLQPRWAFAGINPARPFPHATFHVGSLHHLCRGTALPCPRWMILKRRNKGCIILTLWDRSLSLTEQDTPIHGYWRGNGNEQAVAWQDVDVKVTQMNQKMIPEVSSLSLVPSIKLCTCVPGHCPMAHKGYLPSLFLKCVVSDYDFASMV